ncbi:MAG: hypothetical protein F6K00_06835 [Leptolyngbya sp. SIOISBB]|nr:hypothetical protein [Leptolyngbya sp. SIOISBB]
MLNQFIQICIQIRNAGYTATGCLIDGLIDVVDDFLGHTHQCIHQSMWHPRSDGGFAALSLRLGDRGRLLRLRYGFLPRAGELWSQG